MWDFNWIAIVLAAVAAFAVGGLWYGVLFGKAWMAALGKSEDELKGGASMPMLFGSTFLLHLFSSFILAHVLRTYGDPGLDVSVMVAGGMALGFVLPAMGINYLFQRASLKLFLIDGAHWLLAYSAMGAVFGCFAA